MPQSSSCRSRGGRGRLRRSLDCIYKGTVRTAAVLERQTPDAIDRIHRAIREGAERFTRDGTYEMAWPAVLASSTQATLVSFEKPIQARPMNVKKAKQLEEVREISAITYGFMASNRLLKKSSKAWQ
jgi:hypothetical protein